VQRCIAAQLFATSVPDQTNPPILPISKCEHGIYLFPFANIVNGWWTETLMAQPFSTFRVQFAQMFHFPL
jgi:hypothetical protein